MSGIDRAVRVYRNIRDSRAKLKREYEEKDRELKEKLHQIEVHLMWQLEDQGATSIRTDEGLVYTEETTKASISDWGTFGPWVQENDALDMLQRRVVIGELKRFMSEHDDTPPGISIHRERVVRVRK